MNLQQSKPTALHYNKHVLSEFRLFRYQLVQLQWSWIPCINIIKALQTKQTKKLERVAVNIWSGTCIYKLIQCWAKFVGPKSWRKKRSIERGGILSWHKVLGNTKGFRNWVVLLPHTEQGNSLWRFFGSEQRMSGALCYTLSMCRNVQWEQEEWQKQISSLHVF